MKVPGCLFHFLVTWRWVNGCLDSVPGCLDSFHVPMTWFHDCVVNVFFSWWLGCTSCFPGRGSMAACWRFVIFWTWMPSESCWFPRLASMDAWRRFLPACFTSWVTGLAYMVAWWRFLVARVHFLLPWTWLHGCLVKVPGCLDSVPVSLDLVPWLLGEGSGLPGFTFWCTGLGSMVDRWRFLVA